MKKKFLILLIVFSGFAFQSTCFALDKTAEKANINKAKKKKKKKKEIVGVDQLKEMAASLEFVKPKKEQRILVYSRTTGFRHSSIPTGILAFRTIGEVTGAFSIDASEDPSVFTEKNLSQYDAILMLSTTKDSIPHGQARKVFEDFLAKKKGLIGIHAATDCHSDWPNYLEAMGGSFDGHPWTKNSLVTLYNEEPDHPVSKPIPQGYVIKDEIYQYKDEPYFSREKLRIVVSLDLSGKDMKKPKMKRKDHDYAVSWLRTFTGSRVFYTNLGHNETTFIDKVAMQHMMNGIQYSLGDLEADARPSVVAGNPKPKAPPAGF